jgi:hypothetical protein
MVDSGSKGMFPMRLADEKYCCVLMIKNEEDVAIDILEHVVWSNLFNNRRCEVAIRMSIIGRLG